MPFSSERFGMGKNELKKILMKKKGEKQIRRGPMMAAEPMANPSYRQRRFCAAAILLVALSALGSGQGANAGKAAAPPRRLRDRAGGLLHPRDRLAWGVVGIHYFRLGRSAGPPGSPTTAST